MSAVFSGYKLTTLAKKKLWMNASQLSDKEICLLRVTFEFWKLTGLNSLKKPITIQFCPSVPSSVFVALFQCYLTVLNRYSCTSFKLVTNFYKERINSSLPELEPNTTFFCLQRSYLLNLGKLQWSCSRSPNPKSQLVRYPNRETMGNNDRQWCVIVFCEQWGNTLRAAPTLLSLQDAGLFPLQDAMLTRCNAYKMLFYQRLHFRCVSWRTTAHTANM